MPKYVQAGSAYPYNIIFEVEGELVSPTSANITLKDNAGAVVQSINNSAVTIASNATDAVYNIPSNANAKTLVNELRFIEVNFVYNGVTYTLRDSYEIKSGFQQVLNCQEVRDYLSLTKSELPDSGIDFFTSYQEISDETEADLDLIISSGSSLYPHLKKAWLLKTAINSSKFIELRVMQSEQSDNTIYKRFTDTDFEAIRERLKAEYTIAINAIDEISSDALTAVTGFLVVTGTDPVTGV